MILRMMLKFLVCFALYIPFAHAHEIRPAYLQIDEQSANQYELLWKVPTNNGMVQNIRPVFDAGIGVNVNPASKTGRMFQPTTVWYRTYVRFLMRDLR